MTNMRESGPAQAGPTPTGATATGATATGANTVDVTIRRAPKIPVFLVLGALVGLVGTLIVTALQPADPAIGFAALFGYFSIYGIPLGVVLGGFLAILLDRVSARRAKSVTAEQTTVDLLPEAVRANTDKANTDKAEIDQAEIDKAAEPIEGLS